MGNGGGADRLRDELGPWLDDRAAAHAFSGAVSVHQDGVPLVRHAAGTAHRGHGVPVRHGTRFLVASVTKLPVAVTALRLVDRGLLDLHARVVDVLPPDLRPRATDPRVTLHHLLSHTSGIGNYHDDEDETPASYTANWDRLPTYHVRRVADMVPLFADAPPAFTPPGARFRYADANYLLVGLMIEAATGRSFAECVADEVLGPAGMTDSAFARLDDEPTGLATGYLTDDGPPERWRSNVFSVPATGMPDGGMITTVEDLVRLAAALESGRLLPPGLHAAMTSPQSPVGPDDDESYGYGCELALSGGAVVGVGHEGVDPGVSAGLAHHRPSGTTVAVACNLDRGAWPVVERVHELLGLTAHSR